MSPTEASTPKNSNSVVGFKGFYQTNRQDNGENIRCRHCGSEWVTRYGRSHGKRQRWYCKECKRTFVVKDEGFERSKLGPEAIVKALDLYFKGLSTRKVAEYLCRAENIPVSHQTVYYWLKRYLKIIAEYVETFEPKLSGTWYADEMSLRIGGKWRWLWNVMDYETRFLLASVISSERETQDAIKAFKEALKQAKEKPRVVVTDGLPAYEDAVKRLFWSRYKDRRTIHERHVRLEGDLTTNPIERLQGTVREREKILRGLKKEDSVIIDGFKVYYNFARVHQALGKTPAQQAGIGFGEGKHAWLQLLLRATIHKLMEDK